MDPAKKQQLTPLQTPENVKMAMKFLVSGAQTDVPVVPEAIFCQHLLPMLTNTTGEVDLSIWQDVAGSVIRPIDVADHAGNILFRVPALMRLPETRSNDDPRKSLYEILSNAKLKTEQHPILGSTYLQMQLENKSVNAGNSLDSIRAWNAILVRYGFEPLNIPGASKTEVTAAPASDKPLFGEEDEAL